MTVSGRIFALLAEKGKSQKNLADSIGISQRTISAWKSRNSDPPSDLICAIAAFFEVSLEWLLTGKERPCGFSVSGCVTGNAIVGANHGSVVVRNGEERLLSDEAGELLRIYETLDVRRRMKLLDAAFSLEEEKGGA
jgi:transcriptional regulator with XRE-family HTH domain